MSERKPHEGTEAFTLLGLTNAEVIERLASEGYNELPRAKRRTPFRIVAEVLREPMLALLVGGGVVYLVLGNREEALVLLTFATMSVVITVVQESRTERVLEALRDLTSPRALVIRDGQRTRIPGREVVRGDMLVLSEGDRVPADAALRECRGLRTDESLLTGESVPVRKRAAAEGVEEAPARPGGEDLPFVYSGTLIVSGAGLAEVTATGVRSEVGRIGHSLSTVETEPPRLQAETRRIVRVFAQVGGAVSALAVVLYGTLRGGWLDALLGGIALGMSMLPEEFPVVLTVFMAMGAWRISRARVLTRRASAIETLGSATVLCTDKTGTLTENRMTVETLCLPSGEMFRPRESAGAIPGAFYDLVECSLLASAREPFDPMEKAFHELDRRMVGVDPPHRAGWTLVQAYGLQPDLLAMSHVWSDAQRPGHVVVSKGAPEAIATLCGLDATAMAALMEAVNAMAATGLRVLGVGRAVFEDPVLPESHRAFAFKFVGLVGLADPLRATVPDAIRECRTAGITVVMITGDYPATATAIARQAGLDNTGVMTGTVLEGLTDAELVSRVGTTTVFARIMPEQKLRIVNAFKQSGAIVAMTGDGVNDAPSLKAAHIGIAMGGRGTDVAREASSIVLLDDDFGSIVKAVRLGRRIYDNLRKAMGFIFAVHVPIAGLSLLPLVANLPILFGPMHIAFLEMVIDPVCALVFEAETEERDVMARPPRAPSEPLFSTLLIRWSLLQGLLAFLLVAAIFLAASRRGMPESEVRALTFFSLVLAIVGLIFVNRSFSASPLEAIRRPNPALVRVLLAVTAMLGLTLLWPFASNLFRFGPLHWDDLLVTVAAGGVVLGGLELLKSALRARLQD